MNGSVSYASNTPAAQLLPNSNSYLFAAMQQALNARLPTSTSSSGLLTNLRALSASSSSFKPVNPYAGDSLRPGGASLISPFAFRSIPDIGVMLNAMKKVGYEFKPEDKKPDPKKPDPKATETKKPNDGNTPESSYTSSKK